MSASHALAQDVRPLCVLVVDDSASMRRCLVAILTAAGCDCIEAADGAEAFNIILGGGIDLVVTDLDMPQMDGFGLISAIGLLPLSRGRPPVIVVSGLLDGFLGETRPELRSAAALLPKPIQPAELLRAVAGVLGAQMLPA